MSDPLQSSIYQFLSARPALTAIIGDRLFPVRAPQNTRQPYATFTRITGDAGITMSGASNNREAIMQFDFFSRLYSQLDDFRQVMIDSLQGFTGQLSSTETWFVAMENEREQYEDADKLYHLQIDFRFGYERPVN